MRKVIQKGFSGQAAIAACTLFACTILATAPMISPAQAQSSNSAAALTQRIDRLERELQTLNRSVYKDGAQVAPAAPAASASAYADLATRIATLEEQIRYLTGQNEELGNRIDQQKQQMDRQLTDFEIRFKELEAKGTTPTANAAIDSSNAVQQPPAPTPAVTSNDAPPAEPSSLPAVKNGAAPQDSPTQKTLGQVTSSGTATADAAVAYENAYSFIKSGNYERARAEFTAFSKAYPEHPLASNASYWLAETYFATNDYPTAARMFAESYQKFPKGPKAADSILKLGLSLAATGKTAEACIALKQLKQDFSTGDQAIISRADKEIKNLACS